MYTLRQTWKGIFSEITLLALDKKVKEIDPAWPITAKVELAQLDHLNTKRRYLELQLAATELCMVELEQQLQDEDNLFTPPDAAKRIKLDSLDEGTHLEKETTTGEATLQAETTEIPFNFVFHKLNENNIFGNDDDDALVVNAQETLPDNKENEKNTDDDVTEVKIKPVIVQILDIEGDEKGQWVDTFLNDIKDDDEVTEVKVEPIIIEILSDDEDENETRASSTSSSDIKDIESSRRKASPSCVTNSTNEYVDGHWVNNSTIDVQKLLENAAKIKVEPKDSDAEDDDDCFEEIGEIFPFDGK